MALVGQEPVLFSGSVRDNITYGLESCSDCKVMAAAQAAQAGEFIEAMEHGLSTGTFRPDRLGLFSGEGGVPVTPRSLSPRPLLALCPSPTPGALGCSRQLHTPLPPCPGPS